MTYHPAPRIEDRSAAEIFEEICRRLRDDARLDWPSPTLAAGGAREGERADVALIRIFARYWEIVASRLNQSLDRHFIAYLEMLGVSPHPGTPANTLLKFVPVPHAPAGVRVPAKTQVAATAGSDAPEPVIFETERAMELTTAHLRRLFSLDPQRNAWRDLAGAADAVWPAPMSVFSKGQPADHALFIGDASLRDWQPITRLRIGFDIEASGPPGGAHEVRWFVLSPEGAVPIPLPCTDSTHGLTESGEVVFDQLDPWPECEFRGRHGRWLACRLLGADPTDWSASRVGRIELTAERCRRDVPIEAALADRVEVDPRSDFLPFGPRPLFGSTLYLASSEVFHHPGTEITLEITLTNPHDAADEPPIPRVNADGHPRVQWEYWNGVRWSRLAVTDQTSGFRVSGAVRFHVPADFSSTTVNGIDHDWVRARLVSGDYGQEEQWLAADSRQPTAGVRHRPSTLSPPSIQSIVASYSLRVTRTPDFTMTSNEQVFEDVSERVRSRASFRVFSFPCGPRRAVYLGFGVPHPETFRGRSLGLYVIAEPEHGAAVSSSPPGREAVMAGWQCWDGREWCDVDVEDGSQGLTRTGAVTLLVPEGIAARSGFVDDSGLYWFRILDRSDGDDWSPALRGVLQNTTSATHGVTLENEVVGSSRGAPGQVFHALRTPILEGEILQVREADAAPWEPGWSGQEASADEVESGEIGTGAGAAVWRRWHAVSDLLGSRQDDHHYVLDRQTGEVRFGDGRRGRIPPAGRGNIRLRRYRIGGGAHGNKPAGALVQLRTTLPYVESVCNVVDAAGGVDLEPIARARQRGATTVRHRGRAVTAEDYEDLARLASPEVARARCVPHHDPRLGPRAGRLRPGVVSIVVVPRTHERRPSPDRVLLDHVRSYLDRRRNPATDLVVRGPDYVRIDLHVEPVVREAEEAGRIASEGRAALERYLHPLLGGAAGEGWGVGERPGHIDLSRVCESIPGVAAVAVMHAIETEEPEGAIEAGSFLVYSGRHRIALRYERDLDVVRPI